MFFRKARSEEKPSDEEILRQKLALLINEIEDLKKTAEAKLKELEGNVEVRMRELEDRLELLEERLSILNKVLVSLEPSRRLN